MFKKARLKLTAWYLLIIVFICLFFTIPTYRLLTHEVERFSRVQRFRIEEGYRYDRPTPPPITEDLVVETKKRIAFQLLSLNTLIILFSGVLSYFLAGKTLHPIKEMLDEQYRFVSDSSHELRTPITSIKTAIEVALKDKKPSVANLQVLLSENLVDIDKLQTLSDKLLRLAQVDSKNTVTTNTSFDLHSAIDQVVLIQKNIFHAKKVSVQNKTESLNIVTSVADLQEITGLILENACKYSPSGSKVIISSKSLGDHLEISIIDKGIGIKTKDLPQIFNRFFRSDDVRSSTNTAGYGLGLSIAQKLAKNIKAEISVESKYKKGSTFTIKLPISFS